MSRYGWSTNRDQISPYSSNLSGGVPNVTDEDFSYITSEDLEDTGPVSLGTSAPTKSYHPRVPSGTTTVPEDDILLVKSKGVTYPAHFPAYSIGDGKLRVRDVRDRVGLMMELSERRARRIKLLYKGRQLKEPATAVRDYGVKNNSEVMVVLPDLDAENGSVESSDDDEEMVIVADESGRGSSVGVDESKKRRKKKSRKGRKGREQDGDSNTSPRDSVSNLSVPGQQDGGKSPRSPSRERFPTSGPHAKLSEISSNFTTKLLPQCIQFTASPPTDPKRRIDEHRKISETVMQQVILKLDEVETNGDDTARARRKELVMQVQQVLKAMDAKVHE